MVKKENRGLMGRDLKNSQSDISRKHDDAAGESAKERHHMSVHEYFSPPDEEALEAGECTGNPFGCHCEQCRDWRLNVQTDREWQASEGGMNSEHPFGIVDGPRDGANPNHGI